MTKDAVIDVVHKTIYGFFDVVADDSEEPMSEKDKLLLEVNKVVCNAIKDMPDEERRWIPVTERLPEEGIVVLISCEDLYLHRLNPCIGWRNGQYWNTFTANGCKQILYPTAWMPLPKPYEEGADNGQHQL
ncbi:MAG: DUF551 domain-containing protein [Paludibacteraceae bacterium]|nr:DUF551 domain-containing protein [Paludibacteraceae bacterium]